MVQHMVEQVADLDAVGVTANKIRCHGDYHLGQVLWVENDYVILDFEGEPARSVAERRSKDSPLRDVAGLLRSWNYAAYVGLFHFTQDRPDDLNTLEPWAVNWAHWVSARFLAGYLETAAGASFLPDESSKLEALLQFYVLEKALYELCYEINHRPNWVRIPLMGILEMIQGHASHL